MRTVARPDRRLLVVVATAAVALCLVAGVGVALVLGGRPDAGTPAGEPTDPVPAVLDASGDPAPALTGASVAVGSAGAIQRFGEVTVTVPEDAVPAGAMIHVSAAELDGAALVGERLGPPVHVELGDVELRRPIQLTWDLVDVPGEVADVAVPVRWDETAAMWSAALPAGTTYDIEGDRLTVRARQFSFWDWIANTQQSVFELTGTRVEAPTCRARFKPPPWVKLVVRPDEDLNATALRTCLDPDKDDVITVRVANNRTFTQRLTHVAGDQRFAWRWYGDAEPSLEWVLYKIASAALDEPDRSRMLLAPLSQTAFGLARPSESGEHHVRVQGQVDLSTTLTDVVIWATGKAGVDRAVVKSFGGPAMATLFECGKEFIGGKVTAAAVVSAVHSCVGERKKNPGFAAEVAELGKEMRSDPRMVKAHRALSGLARKLKYLAVAEISFYLSDQLLQFVVGDASMSFNLTGQPQVRGRWTATCEDVAEDSNRLYRNLALSEPYQLDNRDMVDVPGFEKDARAAIRPIDACGHEYAERLARQIRSDWGDQRSARVVIELLAAAHGFEAHPARYLLGPGTFGDLTVGTRAQDLAEVERLDPSDPVGCGRKWDLQVPDGIWFDFRDGDPDDLDYVGVGWNAPHETATMVRTAEGVGVGTDLDDVRDIYGDQLVLVTDTQAEGDPYDAYVLFGSRGALIFAVDSPSSTVAAMFATRGTDRASLLMVVGGC